MGLVGLVRDVEGFLGLQRFSAGCDGDK